MSYIDSFNDYIQKKILSSSAAIKIAEERKALLDAGKIDEATRANLCLVFFTRYKQYNSGTISRQDLLLFVRDFILFVGRFPMPHIIETAIRESGMEFGLSIAADGCADAAYLLPEWLPNHSFVNEVYGLTSAGQDESVLSVGDSLIAKHSRFTNYRSIEQKIAVHAAVNIPADYTLMVSLPTGGGKSLD